MKRILDNCSKRFGFHGWVLCIEESNQPLYWTFSTTRSEVRALRQDLTPDLFARTAIMKAKINIEVLP